MKSKILLLLCLISLGLFAQQPTVPTTLPVYGDVVWAAIKYHAPATTFDLNSFFANARADYFDPQYNNDSYAPPNSILRFRGYGPKYTVTANSISNVQIDRFTVSCTISNYTGQTITSRGVVFATHINPTTSDMAWANGNGGGAYTVTPYYQSPNYLILPGQTYYVRAYTIRTGGIITYSANELTVTIPYPSINTIYHYALETCTNYVLAADVANLGGLSVTDKGFCYSTGTFSEPSLSSPRVSSGSGPSSWETTLTLAEGGDYYAAPYVTLSSGQTYLGASKFIHMDHTVRNYTISDPSVSSITSTSAVISGYTFNYSCANQIDRGIFWGTNSNQNNWEFSRAIAGDNGSFTTTLTGLSPNTTYYISIHVGYYNVGSIYGNQVSFKTAP